MTKPQWECAFPYTPNDPDAINYPGMSQRMWLAGMALASLQGGLQSTEKAGLAIKIADLIIERLDE